MHPRTRTARWIQSSSVPFQRGTLHSSNASFPSVKEACLHSIPYAYFASSGQRESSALSLSSSLDRSALESALKHCSAGQCRRGTQRLLRNRSLSRAARTPTRGPREPDIPQKLHIWTRVCEITTLITARSRGKGRL